MSYHALQSSQASSIRMVCQISRSAHGVWIRLALRQKQAKLKLVCLHKKAWA